MNDMTTQPTTPSSAPSNSNENNDTASELQQSTEALKRKKQLHLILMVLGWSNLGLALTIIGVTVLVGFYSVVLLSINPCPNDCLYSRTVPFISAFVLITTSLFEFWGASRLEPNTYADTGMWVSLLTMVPFGGYLFYLVASRGL